MDNILLSADGLPLRCFGAKAWKQFETKGYIVSLEVVEDEPAMVIWPASALRGTGVYAVCMSAFPYWITERGTPTQAAFSMARRGLIAMSRQPLNIEINTLVDVVLRHIPDVYRMPNYKVDRPTMFETETIIEGKTVAQASV